MKETERVVFNKDFYYLIEYESDPKLFAEYADMNITVPVFRWIDGKTHYVKKYACKVTQPNWFEKLFGLTYERKAKRIRDIIVQQAEREIEQQIHFESVVGKIKRKE